MKRRIALLLIVITLTTILIGCVPNHERLLGTWEFMGYRNERVKSVFKTDSVVVFSENGNGYTYEIRDEETAVPVTFTYAIEGKNTVHLVFDDREAVVEYLIENMSDTLVLDGIVYRRSAVEAPSLEGLQTPSPEPTETPSPEPTETPSPEPTETPTPAPTDTPSPAPSEVPASFQFGGKTIKSGATSVKVEGTTTDVILIQPEEVDQLIELCPDLKDLYLDCCCMEDYSRLGELTSLRKLRISRTMFAKEKSTQLVDIDWVSNLTNLTYLYLNYNEINDIRALADMTNLENLYIGYNNLDNRDLENLKNLQVKELSLFHNHQITDVTALASIETLEFLHIGGNINLRSVEPLKKLPRLESLNISYCPIESYAPFAEFKALKELDIFKCEFVSTYFYYDLADCKTLRTVFVGEDDTEIRYALEQMKAECGLDQLSIATTTY